jgi:hypothetical protein
MSENTDAKTTAVPKAVAAVRAHNVLTMMRPTLAFGMCCSILREQSMHMNRQTKTRKIPPPFMNCKILEGAICSLSRKARKAPLIPATAKNTVYMRVTKLFESL